MLSKFFIKCTEKMLDKKIPAYGLGVFRFFYSITLLLEICQIFYFRHLIFDETPFLAISQLGSQGHVLLLWGLIVGLLAIGLFTRTITALNYLLSVFYFSQLTSFEYHVHYVFLATNFLILFLDLGRCLSLDSLIATLKYSRPDNVYRISPLVPVIYYHAIPFFVIGFFYFDSVLYKLQSNMWMNGLGLWLPASVPFATHINLGPLLDFELGVKLLGYLTLIFEGCFLFCFWIKKIRIPLIIIGAGLHLGIIAVFPIPWFGLAMVALYIPMVPVHCWIKLHDFILSKTKTLTVYYDAGCPLCMYTRILFETLDVRKSVSWLPVQTSARDNKILSSTSEVELLKDIHSVDSHGVVHRGFDTYRQIFSSVLFLWPLGFLLRLQPLRMIGRICYRWVADNRKTERCNTDSCGYTPRPIPLSEGAHQTKLPLMGNIRVDQLRWSALFVLACILQANVSFVAISHSHRTNIVSKYLRHASAKFAGITPHALFTDGHFRNYNTIVAFEWVPKSGDRLWLPILKKDGTPGFYNYGACWRNWTFNTNPRDGNLQKLRTEAPRWLHFWLHKNNLEASDGKFLVYSKSIVIPEEWEIGLLERQLSEQFYKIAEITYRDGELFF